MIIYLYRDLKSFANENQDKCMEVNNFSSKLSLYPCKIYSLKKIVILYLIIIYASVQFPPFRTSPEI